MRSTELHDPEAIELFITEEDASRATASTKEARARAFAPVTTEISTA